MTHRPSDPMTGLGIALSITAGGLFVIAMGLLWTFRVEILEMLG